METEILKTVATQGPWAALFVLLLWWVLRDSAERERRLTHIIDETLPTMTQVLITLKEQVEQLCRLHAAPEEKP